MHVVLVYLKYGVHSMVYTPISIGEEVDSAFLTGILAKNFGYLGP